MSQFLEFLQYSYLQNSTEEFKNHKTTKSFLDSPFNLKPFHAPKSDFCLHVLTYRNRTSYMADIQMLTEALLHCHTCMFLWDRKAESVYLFSNNKCSNNIIKCITKLYIKGSIVNSWYLKVKVHPKLLISQSKFSGLRKFTLRYQYLEITGAEIHKTRAPHAGAKAWM